MKKQIKPLQSPCRVRNEKLPQFVDNPCEVRFSWEIAPALLFPLDTDRLQWQHEIWLKTFSSKFTLELLKKKKGRNQAYHMADVMKKWHCLALVWKDIQLDYDRIQVFSFSQRKDRFAGQTTVPYLSVRRVYNLLLWEGGWRQQSSALTL